MPENRKSVLLNVDFEKENKLLKNEIKNVRIVLKDREDQISSLQK